VNFPSLFGFEPALRSRVLPTIICWGSRLKPRINTLTLLVFITFSFVSCGKVGPPVAPTRLSERTTELTAIQRGSNILLTWPSPTLIQDDSKRAYVARVEIYRLVERRDQEPVLDTDDYEQSAQVIGVLDRAAIETQAKAPGLLHFTDAVALTNSNTRLRYAVRYFNKRGQAAAFSNTVALEPIAAVASPPGDVIAKSEAQDVIRISWSPPISNVNQTSPASVVGYNVYRRLARRDFGGDLLNEEAISGTTFDDTKFQYLTEYTYYVRALSPGATGLVESADSESLSFKPVDTFAPAAPDPVSVASANGTISLFWPSSPEADVVGYNIYRSQSAETPDNEWKRLNDEPSTKVTYRDELVVIDQTYFYRVTAIDRFNNESARSRIVSETVH
jgi:hypothetical protein